MNLKNRLGHLSCDFPFPTLCPQNELTLVLSGLELKPRPVLGGSFSLKDLQIRFQSRSEKLVRVLLPRLSSSEEPNGEPNGKPSFAGPTAEHTVLMSSGETMERLSGAWPLEERVGSWVPKP